MARRGGDGRVGVMSPVTLSGTAPDLSLLDGSPSTPLMALVLKRGVVWRGDGSLGTVLNGAPLDFPARCLR